MHLGRKLGMQIKEARKSIGWTEEELGRRCQVQKAQISKVEKDATHASTTLLFKICTSLQRGISLDTERTDIPAEPFGDKLVLEYRKISSDSVAAFWATKYLRDCIIYMEKLSATNEFEFSREEYDFVHRNLYSLAKSGDKIYAINLYKSDNFSRPLSSNNYLETNINAARRGVIIERVFVYNRENELRNISDVINEHKEHGIGVRVARLEELKHDSCHNSLLFITSSHGKYTVYPTRDKYGKFIKGYVSWNKEIGDRFESIYRTIRKSSRQA